MPTQLERVTRLIAAENEAAGNEAAGAAGYRTVIIPAGAVFYHGTLESFDVRMPRTGGYDDVFWTAKDLLIARSYIPVTGSHMGLSVDHILRDKLNEDTALRKSLGLSKGIIQLAWQKSNAGYRKFKEWEDKKKEFEEFYRKNRDDYELFTDELFAQWLEAEENSIQAMKEWRQADSYLKAFVVQKMRSFGYEPQGYNKDYFTKVKTDSDGNLLPANYRDVGRVLQVTCRRNMKFYDFARDREGDLMEPDYHKIKFFRKLENAGFDGVIINDFAQSDYHGNYGHQSYGFFAHALKDLAVKTIRNQTHPTPEEWEAA